jgi:hypothetical protein
VLIRDLPCEAATPITPNEMEAPDAVPDRSGDVECVANQSIEAITGMIGRIGTRTGSIPRRFGATAK